MRIGITLGQDSDGSRYEAAVRGAGAEPVVLRPGANAVADGLAGLVLAGGVDVAPERFGQPVPDGVGETLTIEPERDELEWALLDDALGRRLPVLAICRGIQLVNVHRGGTLHLDMAHDGVGTMSHRAPAITDLVHRVDVGGGRLATLMPASAIVNSRHHQAVATPGRGLAITAMSEDGVIEGLESDDGLIMGVQWHPEAILDRSPGARELFADLVARAATRRAA
jgi:putative glutamine amidotransferase